MEIKIKNEDIATLYEEIEYIKQKISKMYIQAIDKKIREEQFEKDINKIKENNIEEN